MRFKRKDPTWRFIFGKTSRRLKIVGILMIMGLAFSCPPASYGEEKEIKEYVLPEHGVLQLTVPQSWEDEIQESGSDRPTTIKFRPKAGDQFVLMITPFWELGEENKVDTEEKVKALMEKDWKLYSKKAKESKQTLQKLSGAKANGFYYMVTDKAPKKGEYKFLLRAVIRVGDILLNVTFLGHKKDSPIIREVLQVMEEAQQNKE